MWTSRFPAPFAEGIVFAPGIGFSFLNKYKLVVDVWIDFWCFYSVPFDYPSIFVPVLLYLNVSCREAHRTLESGKGFIGEQPTDRSEGVVKEKGRKRV